MAVGRAVGMHKELISLMDLMRHSRVAVYAHEGTDGNTLMLRELVTNQVCQAICPAGYLGQKGELWYARVLLPR